MDAQPVRHAAMGLFAQQIVTKEKIKNKEEKTWKK
jgi:hypothetical protein